MKNNNKYKIMLLNMNSMLNHIHKYSIENAHPEYDVIMFDNGFSGLEYIQKHHNDIKLVATDIELKGMDGNKLVDIINSNFEISTVGFITKHNEINISTKYDFYRHLPISVSGMANLIDIHIKKDII